MTTCECGKRISDVEYIRYGGVCKECWHKYYKINKEDEK